MTGPMFMRPYQPHAAHIIKMANETRSGTGIPVTPDSELATVLKPSTIYIVRIAIFLGAGGATATWFPECTSAVDFAALHTHRPVADDNNEKWNTLSSGDHWGDAIDTTRFNLPFHLVASNGGARHMTGMVQTGSGGGTFRLQWGGGNTTRTMYAGSFLYLQEAQAY